MTKHDMSSRRRPGIDRRRLLQGAAAGGALLSGSWNVQAQAPRALQVLVPGPLFLPELKEIVEKQANVTVTAAPFGSSVDAVSRLTTPGGTQFDLITAIHGFASPVVLGPGPGGERTLPITLKDVPNISNINDESKSALTLRNNEYFLIPVCWGFDTIIYNTKEVKPEDAQSWGLLFDDKYAGRLAWWDSALSMILAAGLYLGHASPDTMDRKDLDEVGKFLTAKKKNARTIFNNNAIGAQLLANNEVVGAYGPVTMRVELEKKNFPVAGAWCKEGVLSLIQSSFIPKTTKNADAVHAVINCMLGKDYASTLTRACGYLSTSKLAEESFSPDERKRYGFGLFDGTVKQYPQRFPAIMNNWIEVWSRVKSA
jgi:spermidine/putrescine transport system substrate-binding protein